MNTLMPYDRDMVFITGNFAAIVMSNETIFFVR